MNYKEDCISKQYTLINPSKYISKRPPISKSRWEYRLFSVLDNNPYVTKWGYEAVEIFYPHPFYGNWTVYYPDFLITVTLPNGNVMNKLIEVKPKRYAKFPVEPKKPSPTNTDPKKVAKYAKALTTYENLKKDFMINTAKWNAAQVWCQKTGTQWMICTEDEGGGIFTGGNI